MLALAFCVVYLALAVCHAIEAVDGFIHQRRTATIQTPPVEEGGPRPDSSNDTKAAGIR